MQRDPLKTAHEALRDAVKAHPALSSELIRMADRIGDLVDAIAPVIAALAAERAA